MKSAFAQVLAAFPTPDRPTRTGTPQQWETVEKLLGTALPDDYKAFISNYGYCGLGGELVIDSPFTKAADIDPSVSDGFISSMGQVFTDTLDKLRQLDSGFNHALYPEPAGLLYFGTDAFGRGYYWKTRQDVPPNDWTIGYRDDGTDWWEFDGTISELILAIISDHPPEELADTLPPGPP